MATVASPPRPVGAASPPVRHGTCRLTLRIGGTEYTLRPMPNQPGMRAVWVLKKLDPHGSVVHYSVAQPKGAPAGCTCPDHEQRGSICKHIIALAALGLVATPKAARPVKARKAPLRLHAKNARQAIAEAKALPAEARRHLAEISPALPEGWQPGGMHPSVIAARASAAPAPVPAAPSFAAGFRQAVADHLARRNGTATAEAEWPICDGCGCDFDPEISRDPSFCEACMAVGGAA
jgi:SWIM zinc finger